MKLNYWFTLLILIPLNTFCQPQNDLKTMTFATHTSEENTQSAVYTNETEHAQEQRTLTRSSDYPTQIIRMKNTIENLQITCEDVHQQINKTLIENIANNQFIYAFHVDCHYDPQTFLATEFTINSYFDPVSDDAIIYLKTYLSQYNGSNLLGTKLKIEAAKGLIISLSVAAGMKKNPNKPPFVEYRRDRSNFYFSSNYEMKNKLFVDIYENFYSNNEERVLPFLDKWVFPFASSLYRGVLRDSNYVELQPERIFLMENGEQIFVSGLQQYFMHHCDKYENHRCLKPA